MDHMRVGDCHQHVQRELRGVGRRAAKVQTWTKRKTCSSMELNQGTPAHSMCVDRRVNEGWVELAWLCVLQAHPVTWSRGAQQSHGLSISALLLSGSSHPQLCECQTSRRTKHPKQAGIWGEKPSQCPFSKTW